VSVRVDIVTIFPEYFGPIELSLIGRARQAGALAVAVHDLRTWTHDVHRTVDDSPSGGGPGMVMRPEPWGEALDALAAADPPPRLVVPTPAGAPFHQRMASELAAEPRLLFACGRMPVTEVSLGDYVLFGGEVAVLAILEAVVRLLPGVLGNAESLVEESHAGGLLEAPLYTKPAQWRGLAVPEVLRSGDHARIARWRRDQALLRTAARRPDLLASLPAGVLGERDVTVLTGAGFPPPGEGVAE
jgi:tRNA (guanine37-N1)-methyltransferase